MDCGPAALAALLNGCGIDVSYPRLREACQTDVDGTSIDTLEELALRYGLDAEQVMLPNDFLLDSDTGHLPCIAVVTLPNGLTHFVVIWRRRLGWYEVMDPSRGRCWMRRGELAAALYQHEVEVATDDWLTYARSAEFQTTLRRKLANLSIAAHTAAALLDELANRSWQYAARLDAALRMCGSLRNRGIRIRGRDAEALVQRALRDDILIAKSCFQVAEATQETLFLRGAVVLQVNGVASHHDPNDHVIVRTLGSFRPEAARRVAAMLRDMGFARLAGKLAAVGIAMGVLTLIEALIFRYLLGFRPPTEPWTFGLILLAVMLPIMAALLIDVGQTRFGQTLGRHLEIGLRASLLRKLPRIRDDYFASRLASDLAERGHSLSELRAAPGVTTDLLINLSRITLLLVGLVWILPGSSWIVAISGVFALVAPLAVFRLLAERDSRARTHLGALSNLYLDALRGTEPVWTHGGARALVLEHESLLIRWVRASNQLRNVATWFELVQVMVLGACGVALVIASMNRGLPDGTVLLVGYWALFVPILSRGLLGNLKQLPALYNILLRVLEVLDAPEEQAQEQRWPAHRGTGGVKLQFEDLAIVRGNQRVISNLDLTIEPGERVAIVGASGSGKSSFLGAVCGWHAIDAGQLRIDGVDADATTIQALRQETALVDPETYLWNRDIYTNVLYGTHPGDAAGVDAVLRDSELLSDLEKMVDGLATRIGENGSRLSGGESQRLRVARALIRDRARLVLLDEPFSAMDSQQRARMRGRVLARWPDATLLWVSHQVDETRDFPRVLVFDAGRIVEDGAPEQLLATASRYAAMVAQEQALARRLSGAPWHGWRLDTKASFGA
jgi:ATP-binding cassette subfamily B protein